LHLKVNVAKSKAKTRKQSSAEIAVSSSIDVGVELFFMRLARVQNFGEISATERKI
jgi:hypothetical protein